MHARTQRKLNRNRFPGSGVFLTKHSHPQPPISIITIIIIIIIIITIIITTIITTMIMSMLILIISTICVRAKETCPEDSGSCNIPPRRAEI